MVFLSTKADAALGRFRWGLQMELMPNDSQRLVVLQKGFVDFGKAFVSFEQIKREIALLDEQQQAAAIITIPSGKSRNRIP